MAVDVSCTIVDSDKEQRLLTAGGDEESFSCVSDCSDNVVDDDAIGWLVDETIVTGGQSLDAEKTK